jgi:hypothetical protein
MRAHPVNHPAGRVAVAVAVAGRWGVAVSITHAAGRHLSVCQLGFETPSHPPSALVQCTASVVCRRRRLKRRAQRAPTLSHQPCHDVRTTTAATTKRMPDRCGIPPSFSSGWVLHALRVVHHCTAPKLTNNKTLRGAVRNRPSCGGLRRLDRGSVRARSYLYIRLPHRVVAGVTYGPPYSIIHVCRSCWSCIYSIPAMRRRGGKGNESSSAKAHARRGTARSDGGTTTTQHPPWTACARRPAHQVRTAYHTVARSKHEEPGEDRSRSKELLLYFF